MNRNNNISSNNNNINNNNKSNKINRNKINSNKNINSINNLDSNNKKFKKTKQLETSSTRTTTTPWAVNEASLCFSNFTSSQVTKFATGRTTEVYVIADSNGCSEESDTTAPIHPLPHVPVAELFEEGNCSL